MPIQRWSLLNSARYFFQFFFFAFSSLPFSRIPSTLPPLFYLPCALLMILPRDSTGGALPRPHSLSHTSCPRNIVRIYISVYTTGITCRKYSDPSSAPRSLHMHSYVIFELSRFVRESCFIFFYFSHSEKLFWHNLGA